MRPDQRSLRLFHLCRALAKARQCLRPHSCTRCVSHFSERGDQRVLFLPPLFFEGKGKGKDKSKGKRAQTDPYGGELKKRKCFICHQADHMANACPKYGSLRICGVRFANYFCTCDVSSEGEHEPVFFTACLICV